MGIRLVVLDDNPHISWEGRVHPVNATFQHFVSALLDAPGSPVAAITSAVPLRAADGPPATRALDPRIRVMGTAPFDGIAGYLRQLPAMLRVNRPILGRAISDADLLWIKVPASNAALASAIAARAGVPRFVWVAGSAADVAGARYEGATAVGARAVGVGYDLIGRVAAIGGDRVVVGREILTSLVEPWEIRDPGERRWPEEPDVLRLVWAGRLVDGKGLTGLLAAVAASRIAIAPRRLELTLVGDGPARPDLEATVEQLDLHDVVRFEGYVAERGPYLDRLAAADAFVLPSDAEGFPKVVLDAMAAGLPVIARPAGALGRLDPAPYARLEGLTEAITALDSVQVSRGWADLASRGHAFIVDHTRPVETARLIHRWQRRWPGLPWDRGTG